MTRRCVVQKYGGSSVSNVAQIKAVAERVVSTRRTGVDVVVVVVVVALVVPKFMSSFHPKPFFVWRNQVGVLDICTLDTQNLSA